jgi:hypothetical protein
MTGRAVRRRRVRERMGRLGKKSILLYGGFG